MDNIASFTNTDTKCLSIDDKIKILCSINPINCIVQLTHCENPKYHNVLLTSMDAPTVDIYNEGKIMTLDTDFTLGLMIDLKIISINSIIDELEPHLNKKFITDIKNYLRGGCNDEPNFRTKKCKPGDILIPKMTMSKLRKKCK